MILNDKITKLFCSHCLKNDFIFWFLQKTTNNGSFLNQSQRDWWHGVWVIPIQHHDLAKRFPSASFRLGRHQGEQLPQLLQQSLYFGKGEVVPALPAVTDRWRDPIPSPNEIFLHVILVRKLCWFWKTSYIHFNICLCENASQIMYPVQIKYPLQFLTNFPRLHTWTDTFFHETSHTWILIFWCEIPSQIMCPASIKHPSQIMHPLCVPNQKNIRPPPASWGKAWETKRGEIPP